MSDSDQSDAKDGTDTAESTEGDGGDKTSGMGLDPDEQPDDETVEEIEKAREERLDPDNRPENAEVDNSPREFDTERGQFKDQDDYDENEPAPFSDPEDPNNPDNKSDDASDSDDSDGDGDEDQS